MPSINLFYAYPERPKAIAETIESAASLLREHRAQIDVRLWSQPALPGSFIHTAVVSEITQCDLLAADITTLNFNVLYEIGFAIGAGKKILLTRNKAFLADAETRKLLGILDTINWIEYENHNQLAQELKSPQVPKSFDFDSGFISKESPVFVLLPKYKTDAVEKMLSSIARAGFHVRNFDPVEQPRLAANYAIEHVSKSAGVAMLLLPGTLEDSTLNNLRAAFVFGLAQGMNKQMLVLQQGDDPVPIDYRDLVNGFQHVQQIRSFVDDFAPRVVNVLQTKAPKAFKGKSTFLGGLSLGASNAENEVEDLPEYYLETEQYRRATRGEARIVVGRKGSGKTAMFCRIRSHVDVSSNLLVDLKPEGYRLRKFNEVVGSLLLGGTREHTIMACWEYLLLLEVCERVLGRDHDIALRDPKVFNDYRAIEEAYQSGQFERVSDFSERSAMLLNRIEQDYREWHGNQPGRTLREGEVTELVYKHDVRELRSVIGQYLKHKNQLWFLIDNLDKGWPAHGLSPEDLIIIQSLLEAARKIERDFRRGDFRARVIVFLRNDVYDLLLSETADRGKDARIVLDWTDPELLREMLRRRLIFRGAEDVPFDDLWPQLCVSHYDGEESSKFLIDRCLMRPRWLIDLLEHCRSHAVNLGAQKIGISNLEAGLNVFSGDLLTDLGYEMRDVVPDTENLLYEFLGVAKTLDALDLDIILAQSGLDKDSTDIVLEILLWYGFLGVIDRKGAARYIYSVQYDMKRLRRMVDNIPKEVRRFEINPAFWKALELH